MRDQFWKLWAVVAWTDTLSKNIYIHELYMQEKRSPGKWWYTSLPAPESERERERNSRGREEERPWKKGCEKSLEIFGMCLEIFGSLRVWSGILQNFLHSQEKISHPYVENVGRYKNSVESNHQFAIFLLGFCRRRNDARVWCLSLSLIKTLVHSQLFWIEMYPAYVKLKLSDCFC